MSREARTKVVLTDRAVAGSTAVSYGSASALAALSFERLPGDARWASWVYAGTLGILWLGTLLVLRRARCRRSDHD